MPAERLPVRRATPVSADPAASPPAPRSSRPPVPLPDPTLLSVPFPGFTRVPLAADASALAPVRAIEVDGVPFATPVATPDTDPLAALEARVHALDAPDPESPLFPIPRLLTADHADLGVRALAQAPLQRDERNPLRTDLHRLLQLVFALRRGTVLSAAFGSHFLTGTARDTEAGAARWRAALRHGRTLSITLDRKRSKWLDLMVATETGDDQVLVSPPAWWLTRAPGTSEGPLARWRLSGSLWRPRGSRSSPRGLTPTYWGSLYRTLSGIEAGLCWCTPDPLRPAMGAGWTPPYLVPEQPGGPGPGVFVGWSHVLHLAGEPLSDDRKVSLNRYRRRIGALCDGGYLCPRPSRPAPVGDTVEILGVQRGGRSRPAGLFVRASARFCAAYASVLGPSRVPWTFLPAESVLTP